MAVEQDADGQTICHVTGALQRLHGQFVMLHHVGVLANATGAKGKNSWRDLGN